MSITTHLPATRADRGVTLTGPAVTVLHDVLGPDPDPRLTETGQSLFHGTGPSRRAP
jgi:hypothetical protein